MAPKPKSGFKRKPTGARRRPWLRRKRSYPTNVNRSLQPIPQRYICRMKYSETITTDITTGMYYFNLNSVYDPNRSGGGHQPYGHDTLATLYNRYRVISCNWRINLAFASTASSAIIQAQPANEQLMPSTGSEMRENPRSKYICQNPGSASRVLQGRTYLPSLVGRTKSQYMGDDRYQAQVGTNPQELAILNVMATGSGDTGAQVALQVVLEYQVEWFDIKHLAQS